MVKFQEPRQKTFSKKGTKISSRKITTASLQNRIVEQPKIEQPAIEPSQKVQAPVNILSISNSSKVNAESKNRCLSSFSKLGGTPSINKAELLGREPEILATVAKKSSKKVSKPIHPRIKKAKNKIERIAMPKWIEEDLDNPELNSQNALDNPSPLDELAQQSFKEDFQEGNTTIDPLMAAVQWQYFEDPSFPFEKERPLYVTESVFQRMPFDDLRNKLNVLKSSEDTVQMGVEAPKATLAWSQTLEGHELVLSEIRKTKAQDQNSEGNEYSSTNKNLGINDLRNEIILPASSKIGEVLAEANFEVKNGINKDEVNNILVNPSKRSTQDLKGSLGPLLASPVDLGLDKGATTQSSEAKALTTIHNSIVNSTVLESKESSQNEKDEESNESSTGGIIYGEINADDATLSWLKARKGHVELYLNRVGSKDPQDAIYLLDYQFPNSGRSFEIDGTGIKGKYYLVAGIYVPDSAVPIAQISYPRPISAENYREKIHLNIQKDAIVERPGRDEAQRNGVTVSLALTLFDGAPANYRKPKTVKDGEITVVGFPELGKYKTDKEGNVRIGNVPAASELIIEAKAPGYFPTRHTVPIFSTVAYSPIYLVEKDKVEVVSHYFTKRPQQIEKSMVMGRIYDIKTRTPLAGETLSLSQRKGSAVYFGALPDISGNATLDTGLFGFYNVEPSIRAISRSSNRHSQLLNMEPGYGYFVEFGRGGSRNLLGQLVDPFSGRNIWGSVQLVGDSQEPEATTEIGKFKIPELDLSPGVVTLEAYAEGYPRTWFTIPWTSRETEKEKIFYMMERDLIRESAIRIARVRHEKNTGVIVGGAHPAFFKKGRNRIGILLLNSKGQPVSEEHGPFSLNQIPKHQGSFVITPKSSGFTFFNLSPGEYILKMMDPSGRAFRAHVVRVGVERVSIVVN